MRARQGQGPVEHERNSADCTIDALHQHITDDQTLHDNGRPRVVAGIARTQSIVCCLVPPSLFDGDGH